MKYAIYVEWNDGFEDSVNVNNAKERTLTIEKLLDINEFKSISYCKIYTSGEYGGRKIIL